MALCLSFLIYKRVRSLFYRVMVRIQWNILHKGFQSVHPFPFLHNTDLFTTSVFQLFHIPRYHQLTNILTSFLSHTDGVLGLLPSQALCLFLTSLLYHCISYSMLKPTMTISDEPNGFSSILSWFGLHTIYNSGIPSPSDSLLVWHPHHYFLSYFLTHVDDSYSFTHSLNIRLCLQLSYLYLCTLLFSLATPSTSGT